HISAEAGLRLGHAGREGGLPERVGEVVDLDLDGPLHPLAAPGLDVIRPQEVALQVGPGQDPALLGLRPPPQVDVGVDHRRPDTTWGWGPLSVSSGWAPWAGRWPPTWCAPASRWLPSTSTPRGFAGRSSAATRCPGLRARG